MRFELTPSFDDQELLVKVTLTWRLRPLGHLTMRFVDFFPVGQQEEASEELSTTYTKLVPEPPFPPDLRGAAEFADPKTGVTKTFVK